MKFIAVLLALATAAIAVPAADLDARGDRDSCDEHGKNHCHNYGDYGNYDNGHRKHSKSHGGVDHYRQRHGKQKYCDNWVPVDKDLIALDITADICVNANVAGLIDVNVNLDVEVGIDLLRQNYPTYQSLYRCPQNQCKKGQKVHKDKCWEHEFDGKYKHGNGRC